MQNVCLASALRRWADNAQEQHKHKQVFGKAVRRVQGQAASACLSTWRNNVASHRQYMVVVGKV
jgi:hypothetical protein